jgi:hypothetical protein
MFLKDSVYALVDKKLPWMVFTIAFATINTGGYMWNTIRNPPFMPVGRDGGLSLIAGGFQNQFGVETFIVAGICKSLLLPRLHPKFLSLLILSWI